jgi:hypothetical protein
LGGFYSGNQFFKIESWFKSRFGHSRREKLGTAHVTVHDLIIKEKLSMGLQLGILKNTLKNKLKTKITLL